MGAFFAFVIFAAVFCVESKAWPIKINTESAIAFYHSIKWGVVLTVVLAGGLWGFLFNNELGEELSRAERHSRHFRK